MKNPWSAADWNVTAQTAYLKEFGVARARARAHDAGSVLGAIRPPSEKPIQSSDKKKPLRPAPVVRVRANEAPIRRFDDGSHFIPHRRQSTTLVSSIEALGFDMSSTISLEQLLTVAQSFGFDQATVLEAVTPGETPATMDMGFDQATVLSIFASLASSQDLGFDQATVLDILASLASSQALGFDQAVTVSQEARLTSSQALGFDQAVTVTQEASLSTSQALGFDQAVTVTAATDITEAVTLQEELDFAIVRSRSLGITDAGRSKFWQVFVMGD